MSVPGVILRELDGQLGVLPSGLKALAVVGTASAGPLNTPITYSRTSDVIATYGSGPLVHAVCYNIKNYDAPTTVVRCGNTTAATEDTIDTTGVLGTSVVTYGADTTADDDYDFWFKVVTGGTVGTAGITYQTSDDGGNTWSAIQALGTANSIVIPNTGGVGFAFAAGTLLAGDLVKGRSHAPQPNGTDVGAALLSLQQTAIAWDIAEMAFDVSATLFDAIETGFGAGKMLKAMWAGSVRTFTNGETESAYLTAQSTAFGSKSSTRGMLCAAGADITSGVNLHKYRRPIVHAVAARLASVTEEIDIADVDLGTLPGVAIRDANGNPKYHDELINPGLDDARFTTLRTSDDAQGVFVNNPRIFSATGSDFQFAQHRRVMNLFRTVVNAYFVRRLSKPILVSAKTGKILPSEADAIDSAVNALVRSVIMTKPKASGGGLTGGKFVAVSRDDILLSTNTLTGQGSLVPLAYPKSAAIDIGFSNPALRLVAV